MNKKYQVVIIPSAQKDLDAIPDKFLVKIEKVFDLLELQPYNGKKLKNELTGYYSMRAWPYRVIYEIRELEVLVAVIKVGHRKDVYRK